MTAWIEAGRKAQRYLGTSVLPQYLKRGDIITGFHLEPVEVVEGPAEPHPTHEGWWTVQKSTPYGVGWYVMTEGATASVGRIPLANSDRGPQSALLGNWTTPCGCVVNKGEHCEECGPYNGASPLCMNTWKYTQRSR
ncbi:hypothetical protein OHA61_30615 [Streptomyces sp. NBC_00885]|uniref:hypothetical protein n=1 Tax=Streptomyces sp. NBC_00885 TaxID=2975857 RepID=UPI00386BE6A1|nr:hypothetical protein OHA61_30615 [Streptomyces sp. NBC_00885]